MRTATFTVEPNRETETCSSRSRVESDMAVCIGVGWEKQVTRTANAGREGGQRRAAATAAAAAASGGSSGSTSPHHPAKRRSQPAELRHSPTHPRLARWLTSWPKPGDGAANQQSSATQSPATETRGLVRDLLGAGGGCWGGCWGLLGGLLGGCWSLLEPSGSSWGPAAGRDSRRGPAGRPSNPVPGPGKVPVEVPGSGLARNWARGSPGTLAPWCRSCHMEAC